MRFFLMFIFGLIFSLSEIVFIATFIDYLADGVTIFTQAAELAKTSFVVGLASLVICVCVMYWPESRRRRGGRIYPTTQNVGLMSSIRKRLGE